MLPLRLDVAGDCGDRPISSVGVEGGDSIEIAESALSLSFRDLGGDGMRGGNSEVGVGV